MFLLKILFFVLSPTSIFSKQACQCTYGSECWPSNSDFQTLASQVSQPLVYPAPPATPCYDSTTGNCSDVHASWSDAIWRFDQPGASEHSNWETYTFPNGTIEACYLNTTLGIPHDFLGRSSGRGSFLIWTHHLKNITFHDSFCPTAAKDPVTYDNVFTFGAGVQWFEAFEAVKKQNRLIVGYVSPRGGAGAAGGWPQGGGLSMHVNSDLFWALRGGGGGTWGIVTSVTYKTHPSTPFSTAFFSINSTNANSNRNLLTEIIRLTPLLAEQGYGGYCGVSVDSFQLYIASPNVTADETKATFLPFFEFAYSQPGLSVQNGDIELVSTKRCH